jgi:putative ABC transport system permease protein
VINLLALVIAILFTAGAVAAGFLPEMVVFFSVPFLYVLGRKPVLRRLALRNASRRPRETALILLGALFGTAIITGSAIVGDTLGVSIRRNAFTQLGPVDEVVRSTGFDRRDEIIAAVRSAPQEGIDGILPILSVQAAVAAADGGETKAEPSASLHEIDFAEARAFGGDPEATGISGPTPSGETAVITRDLARTLDVEPGERVDVYAYGAQRTFVVDRVLDRVGVAGFKLGFGSRSPNLFVPPGTIAALAAQAPSGAAPPISYVAISNVGDVIAGADRTERVKANLEAAVAGMSASVREVKSELLEGADEQGRQFTELFSSLGFFSVVAGILLLVNIFVMLAQERKTELGMLRAVGLRRASLVGTFSLEGWLYSLGAAALGTIAGIGVGRAIVFVTSGIFSRDGAFTLELEYHATSASIARGFLVGFVMSLVTVVGTSLYVSRLNVIRAIRDLPEPTAARQRTISLVLGAIGVVIGALMIVNGWTAKQPALLLIGPAVLGLGLAPLLRRLLPRRLVNSLVAGGILLWAVSCFDIAGEIFDNPDISLFVVSGLVLTISAVALLSQHQELIGRVLRRLGGGNASLSLRLGLAYPLARRFRTSIILMTFAIVMFVLVSMTLFNSVFQSQIDDFTADVSGGFDLRVFSNPANPVPLAAVQELQGVEAVSPLAGVGAEFSTPLTGGEFEFWPVAGFEASWVERGPPSLGEVDPRFPSEDAAFRAVLADPGLIIIDEFFLQNGGGPPEATLSPGDRITIRDPASGRTSELTVAALADAGFGEAPAYMGLDGVKALFGDRAVANTLFVATAPAVDPEQVAERINGQFLANGADASSFRSVVAEGLEQQAQFLRLMQGYLALGLIVGIAGLGVVMVRAVRERRREIGVLRSLGFDPKQVRRAFVLESGFIAVEGIVTGTVLAVITSWRLLTSGAFGDGLEFGVPFLQISVVVGVAFVAAMLATASPAKQASKIQPAVALRITD